MRRRRNGYANGHPRNDVAWRIAYADERFALGAQRGSQTDRGRTYVQLGPSEQIESHPSSAEEPCPFEIWRYHRSEQEKPLEEFLVAFVGQAGCEARASTPVLRSHILPTVQQIDLLSHGDYKLPSPGAVTP